MMTKTTVSKRTVFHGDKQFRLTYSLLTKNDFQYGIEVVCRDQNRREAERIWTGATYGETLRILRLFAGETVFPVALRETWENL